MKQALSPDQRARLPLFSLDQIADKWDFTSVTIQLVASLHGKYEGWAEVEKYGIARIGKVVRDQGWVPTAGKRLNSIEAQVRLSFLPSLTDHCKCGRLRLPLPGIESRQVLSPVVAQLSQTVSRSGSSALPARAEVKPVPGRHQDRLPFVLSNYISIYR